MKSVSALTITGITAAWGVVAGNPYLWLPISGFLAGVLHLLTRKWVRSPTLGEQTKFSLYLRLVFTLMGTYSMISQFACVALMAYWVLA